MNRRQLLLSLAAVAAGPRAVFAAPSRFVEGQHYQRVDPPAPASRDRVDVVFFFAYTCPHCLQFEPYFEKWLKTAPSDVAVKICPVAWQDQLLPFTQVYYALDALKLLDKLHLPFFESVIYQEHEYSAQDPLADIADFMKSKGVDMNAWNRTIRSFGVMNKSRVATQTWQNYRIDSTPMIGVGGLYATGPQLVGSREDTMPCVDELIELVRRQRG